MYKYTEESGLYYKRGTRRDIRSKRKYGKDRNFQLHLIQISNSVVRNCTPCMLISSKNDISSEKELRESLMAREVKPNCV
jgi:hypothetical protein